MLNNVAKNEHESKLLREYKVQSIDLIKNFEHNSRTHSEEQIQEVVNSIKRYGYTNPILVDENNVIIAGHCRVIAATRYGMTEIPTIIIDGLTDVEKAELVIADNKLALNAGWDFNILADQITFIRDNGGDVDATGFKPDELTFMADEVPAFLGDEDDVPEPPADPITKRGDIYKLGNHRLMCGDSTMIDDVEKMMDGEIAELLFTSPPYSDMREYSGNDLSLDTITTIFNSFYKKANFYIINLGLQYKNNEINPYWNNWIESAKSTGLKLLSWNVWDKVQSGSISNQSQMFALCHEWIFVFGEKPKKLNRIWEKSENSEKRKKYFKVNDKGQKVRQVRQSDGTMELSAYGRDYDSKNMGTVITHFSEQERMINHPAKYPVGLPEPYIESVTNEMDIVIDCFGGSGSTLIACEKTNRKCFMMELAPNYCDVIVARWEKLTGKKAELINDARL